jgi:uracil-DNA glycosylase family protein
MARNGGGERPGAWVPERPTLTALRAAAPRCHGCELYLDATQVVFSSGRATATIMLVGEQPGDQEDRSGRPFVGPAGKVLDEAVDAAGLDRGTLYLTNAVKHFRFVERGKRRIHRTPEIPHILACRPWLEAELDAVRAAVVVCLGTVAGRAVLGRPVRIGAERGKVIGHEGRLVVITTHPSAVLRLRGEPGYRAAFDSLVSDLVTAGGAVQASSARPASGRRPGA